MARAATLDCFAPAGFGATQPGLVSPRQSVHQLSNPWQLAIQVPSGSCCTAGAATMSPRGGAAAATTPGGDGGLRSARRVLATCSQAGSYADVSCWLDQQISMRSARSTAASWAAATPASASSGGCSWQQLAACGSDEASSSLAPASPGAASLCESSSGDTAGARCGAGVLPPPAFQLLGLL